MKLLVRRYVCDEQRKRDDFGVTEDDVMEIRQDISTLRYELIDIFNKNGMKTPKVNKDDGTGELSFGNCFRSFSNFFFIHSRRQEGKNDGAKDFERLPDRNRRRSNQ
jgi:hypothetical protein